MSAVLTLDAAGDGSYSELSSGLIVPTHVAKQRNRPIGIDCFAGAGGFSLGMKQAGWNVAAAIEWELTAAHTYMVNLSRYGVNIHYVEPSDRDRFEKYLRKEMGFNSKANTIERASVAGSGWISHQPEDVPGTQHFFLGDFRKVTGKMVLGALGLKPGEVDCVFGGPPCQGFSTAGKRDVMDERNSLVFDFARFVLEVQPKTMVMENVPGLLSMKTPDGMNVVEAFCRILSDGGFSTYDALRSNLMSFPDARAASNRCGRTEAQPAPSDNEQLDLFGEAS